MIARRSGRFLLLLVLFLGGLSMLVPFWWMVATSVKPDDQLFVYPPEWIPRSVDFRHYARVLSVSNFGRYVLNSFILVVVHTLTYLALASVAGYAFARLRFPGRETLFIVLLATMMIPQQVTMIPVFLMIKGVPFFGGNDLYGEGGIGWMNSWWGLIVPSMVAPFGIFLMRQFFQTLPVELEDAGRIDGASEFAIFGQIMLPLAGPALVTLSLFSFDAGWSSFLWPLLITTTDEMRTIQLGLMIFRNQFLVEWGPAMAGATLATIPSILIFIAGQRYFVRGIAMTGLKG